MEEEIQCLDAEAFVKWVSGKNIKDFEDAIKVFKENNIDGHTFINLTDRDLKDLFPSFVTRKKVRDLQIEQTTVKTSEGEVEISTPPPKKAPKKMDIQVVATPSPSHNNTSARQSPILRVMTNSPGTSRVVTDSTSSTDGGFKSIPIPSCGILTNPSEHTEKEVDGARMRMVRLCMDSLISLCSDRPTEFEIINLAKSLATQYSALRDDSSLPARNNYRATKKFLERRMYNITPPRTNRGRKRKARELIVHTVQEIDEEQGDHDGGLTNECEQEEIEQTVKEISTSEQNENGQAAKEVTTSAQKENGQALAAKEVTTSKQKENGHAAKEVTTSKQKGNGQQAAKEVITSEGHEKEDSEKGKENSQEKVQENGLEKDQDKEIQIDGHGQKHTAKGKVDESKKENENSLGKEDRCVEAIDKDLRKCSSKSNAKKVHQLLKLTLDHRAKIAENYPKSIRVENLLEQYPVFKSTETLIANLILTVNLSGKRKDVTVEEIRINIHQVTTDILDYVFAKNLTSISRTALKSEDQQILIAMAQLPIILKGTKDPSRTAPLPLVVHIVKKEEMWQDVAAKHKSSSSPWIMYQKNGNEELITIMIKQKVITKASNAVDAVLALMGVYYMAMLPYPLNCSAALLYFQGKVLEDNIHEEDQHVYKKAKKLFSEFKTSEVDLFG